MSLLLTNIVTFVYLC